MFEVGRADLLGALRKDDAKVNALVLNTLAVLGALEERNLEDVAVTRLQLPQVRLQVAVPSDPEAVVPATENGVAGPNLKVGLARSGPEAAGGDVADVIGEIGVDRAGLERHLQGAESRGGRAGVDGHLPLNTREVVLQRGTTVGQPVALLYSQIATPK